MRYGEYELIADSVSDATLERMMKIECPKSLNKSIWYRLSSFLFNAFKKAKNIINKRVEIPASLDGCTIGEIVAMVGDIEHLPYVAGKLLLHLEPFEMRNEEAGRVLSFSIFVQKELERILKIFDSTKVEPDADEKRAGVQELGKITGMFGMIDYLSKRQHISLEDAEKMNWRTVVALMIIDKENAEYNRRLMQVRSSKYKTK